MNGNQILTKTLLIALGFVAALFVYYYLKTEWRLDGLRAEQELKIEKEKERHIQERDSLKTELIKQTEQLRNDINQLTEYTGQLKKRIRSYETRPDFDLDFLTAADIISRSNYKPTE